MIGFVGKPNFATVISRKVNAPFDSQPLCRLHSMQRNPPQCIAAEEVMTKLTLPHETQGRCTIWTANPAIPATPVVGVALDVNSPLALGEPGNGMMVAFIVAPH